MDGTAQQTNYRIIASLTLIHFIGDFYFSFINPLLPIFIDKYGLSLAQVGILTGLARVLAFVVQPPVGYFADHYRTRFFILGGPLLVMTSISMIGMAPAFWVLLLLVSFASVGSSMFHPSVAGMVSEYAGRHFGFSMSLFNMGGTLSFGLGPIFITWFVAQFGLQSSPFSLLIGLPVMIYLYQSVPRPSEEGLKDFGLFGSLKVAFGAVWKPVLLVWAVMVMRAYVSQSLLTFLPVLYARQGFSLLSIGVLVGSFTIAGALSGLVAGHLSDRIGFKPIFYVSNFLTAPVIYLLLLLPGNWIFITVPLAGFVIFATLPLGVALAQRIAPLGKSMVSSLIMGLAMGTGGLLTPVTGKMADLFTITPVLMCLGIIPLLSLGVVYFLPEPNRD